MLGYGKLAVVEDLEEGKKGGREGNLDRRVSQKGQEQGGEAAYPNIEHHDKVEGSMAEEQDNRSHLGQLKPWYPQLGQTKEEGELDEDPFQKEVCAVVLILHQRYPVVELPGHEGHVYTGGIEALCRRIEDGEGYHWGSGRRRRGLVFWGRW